MPIRKDRVIIDTNLWISFLLTKDVARLDKILSDESIILLFSQELLDEFLEVARRPKFKKYFSILDLQDLLLQIRIKAEFVVVTTFIDLSRDTKDNFLLSLANDGKANYLLTGDNDLLVLKEIGCTKLMTISEFFAEKNAKP